MAQPPLRAACSRAVRRNHKSAATCRRLTVEQLELRRLLAVDLSLGGLEPNLGEGLALAAEGENPSYYIPLEQRLAFSSFTASGGPSKAKLYVADPLLSPAPALPLLVGGVPDPAGGQAPDWSPDGSLLLYSRAETLELWIVNAFTGKSFPVLDQRGAPVIGQTPVWVGDLNHAISWAGGAFDSQTNVYSWDIIYCGIDFHENHAELAHVPLNATDHPAADYNPSWSPDGTKLIFESDRSGRTDIYLMDFYFHDGVTLPEAQNLTANRPLVGDFNPEFSPNGHHIAFASTDGHSEIWVMDADGNNQRQVTSEGHSASAPTWSPDGSHLAYSSSAPVSDGSIDTEIYTIRVDGSDRRQITNNNLFEKSPSWRIEAVPPSDLAVFITGPDQRQDDDEFELVVTSTNLGLAPARDITVKVTANYGLELLDGDAPSGSTLSLEETHATLRIPALAVGATLRLPLQVRVYRPGVISLDATIDSADDNDPEHSNNGSSHLILVKPKNDDFAKARRISGATGSIETTNTLATRESNLFGSPEPFHATARNGTPVSGGSSIWYRWFAPEDGLVTFNTKGSKFDTLLAAYEVATINGSRLLPRASNDDANGVTSEIKFQATKGADYYIAIDGYQGRQGAAVLNWSQQADVKPVPRPQKIQSLSRATVLRGSGDQNITLQGSHFDGTTRVYVLEQGEPLNTGLFQSRNFVQTTFRNDSTKLEVSLPARFFSRAQELRLVTVRGNMVSNEASLRVSEQVTLPSGAQLILGRLKLKADMIMQIFTNANGEGENGVDKYELKGHVAFNNYLAVEGASVKVTIDRNANRLNVQVSQGRVLLTNLPTYGNVTLWSGSNFEFSLDGQGELTNLLRAQVETPLREKGLDLTIRRAKLLLGTQNDAHNRPIFGIEIDGTLKFNNVFGLLNVPIQFNRFLLTQNEGLKFATQIGPLSFGVPNLFSVEDVLLEFIPGATPDHDVFRGKAAVVTGFGLKAKGFVEIRAGRINGVGGEIEVPPLTGFPLGPLNITGGNVGVENLLNLSQLRVSIGADLTILAPAVSNILRLDNAQVYYQLPASFGGSAALQIFNVNAADARLDIDLPNAKYAFGGSVTLIPSFPIFVVRGELAASFRGDGSVRLSGYAEGVVQIPDGSNGVYDVLKACGKIPILNIEIGPCLKFPLEIASARLSYKDGAFSFSTDLPIVGSTTLRIKQTQQTVTASVELFSNFMKFRTAFRFGGAGESLPGYQPIGDITVAANSPRLVVSVAGEATAPAYDLVAPDGTRYTPETAALMGATYFFNEETHDSVYVIENPQAGEWLAEAHAGVVDVVELEAWGVNAAPVLMDLVATPTVDGHHISYTVEDVDDDARVSLYYTTSPDLTNGKLIAEDLLESEVNSFTWKTDDGSVPSGTYYIYALADDGLNAPTELFTAVPVEVIDPLAPATPVGVTLTPGKENSIHVSWEANTESDLGGYQIWYGEDDIDGQLDQRIDVGLNRSFTLTRLESVRGYRVAVVAYDKNLETDPFAPQQESLRYRFSLPSPVETAVTGFASPPAPYFFSIDSTKLFSGNDLLLEWNVLNADDLESQQLFLSRDDGQTYQLLADFGPEQFNFLWRASAADASAPGLRFRLDTYDTSGNLSSVVSEDFDVHSAGSIEFSQPSLNVVEGQAYVSLIVRRVGGEGGTVSAQFATQSDTAIADQDFVAMFGQIVFEDGETEQELRIPIIDDVQLESLESFQVLLTYPEGGALLGSTTEVVIQITSDDVVTDSDGDGILDSVENLAPGGDGNNDGIPDAQQANVASLFSGSSATGVTIVSPAGTSFANVRSVASPTVAGLPSFLATSLGAFELVVNGVASGSKINLQLIPHGLTGTPTYLSWIKSAWAWLPSTNASGFVVELNRILIALSDGGIGDVDEAANGQLRVVAAVGQSNHSRANQNPLRDLDVNADGIVSPIDSLIIINDLNRQGSRALPAPTLPRGPDLFFIDTSGDDFVSAVDVLKVINFLNGTPVNGGQAEGERGARPGVSSLTLPDEAASTSAGTPRVEASDAQTPRRHSVQRPLHPELFTADGSRQPTANQGQREFQAALSRRPPSRPAALPQIELQLDDETLQELSRRRRRR